MDLVQTVRKEGSRGGRADFTWEDVKNDAQRENYLGHSLMAPVGRWQQGRDLGWYARGDDASKEAEAARIVEEKRTLKEAEEDAMLVAMGLPVPVRDNANLTPLGQKAHDAHVQHTVAEKAAGEGGQGKARTKEKERSRTHRRHHDDDEDGARRTRRRSTSRSRHQDSRHRHRHRSRSPSPRHGTSHRERDHRRRHRSPSREHKRHDEPPRNRRERDRNDRPSNSPPRERRRQKATRSTSPYTNDKRRTN